VLGVPTKGNVVDLLVLGRWQAISASYPMSIGAACAADLKTTIMLKT